MENTIQIISGVNNCNMYTSDVEETANGIEDKTKHTDCDEFILT